DTDLLTRLLEHPLRETPPFPEGGAIEGLRVEARGVSTLQVFQGDLFRGHLEAEGEMDRMVSRLAQRLGRDALQIPSQGDAHHPDREGFWSPFSLDPGQQNREERTFYHQRRACVRRLEVPRPITRIDEHRWCLEEGGPGVAILFLHGPEVLSGCWWSAPYERSTYWCLTDDQRVLWVYRDRVQDRWYLQGWLD
ncbi:MAG: hypothetical protein VX938_11220, partial [Myxococcota bacterium]|nr:hypothetical protein [Myxococcota bacterium]